MIWFYYVDVSEFEIPPRQGIVEVSRLRLGIAKQPLDWGNFLRSGIDGVPHNIAGRYGDRYSQRA